MTETQGIAPTEKNYEGLGGWLILIAIGLVIAPLRMGFLVFRDLLPAFSEETWSVLTTPGTEVYHKLWAPLLIFELLTNIIFIVFAIVLLVFLVQKKRLFPKLIIAYLAANLLFLVVDYFGANLIPFVANQTEALNESIGEIGRGVIASAIWIPYFLKSRRVKATFVR